MQSDHIKKEIGGSVRFMSEFKKRLLTGIALVIGIAALPYAPPFILQSVVMLLAIIGLVEFLRIFKNDFLNGLLPLGVLFTGIYYLVMICYPQYEAISLVFLLLTSLTILVFSQENRIYEVSVFLMGFFYIPYLFFNLAKMPSKELFWSVFLISFGTDTFAYVGGYLFGKHKLCPKISPAKTIEGAVSGIIGSSLLMIFYFHYVVGDFRWTLLVPTVIASVFGQIGDLTASKFKRANEVKDYGKIFPGHGGVMDRFDSVLFVAPLVRLFLILF